MEQEKGGDIEQGAEFGEDESTSGVQMRAGESGRATKQRQSVATGTNSWFEQCELLLSRFRCKINGGGSGWDGVAGGS